MSHRSYRSLSRSSRSYPAVVMRRGPGSVHYRDSLVHVIDHVDYTAPTRLRELDPTDPTDHTDHTDQESICSERSRSPNGNP